MLNKEVLLAAFLDIKGSFDSASLEPIVKALRRRGIVETIFTKIDPMVRGRLIHLLIVWETIVARVTILTTGSGLCRRFIHFSTVTT